MASYYYLMSSLPMLKSDGDLPFGYDVFLEKCQSVVPWRQYEILRDLTLASSEGPLLFEWGRFYGAFKAELDRQRRMRLGLSAEQGFSDDATQKLAAAVMAEENPLNAENLLLAIEFQKLDELVGMHSYDDYALMGYGLKLKLLERKFVFSQKAGKRELDRLLDVLEEKVKGVR